jgi:hypothetical protein
VAELLEHRASRAGLESEYKKVLPNGLTCSSVLFRRERRGNGSCWRHIWTRSMLQQTNLCLAGAMAEFTGAEPATPKVRWPQCSQRCASWRWATRGRPHTEIVFVGLVDEENSQSGSRALAASGYKADLAIVGEPTSAKVVDCAQGQSMAEV